MIRIEEQDLLCPELTIYSARRESQLMHMREPAPGLFIAETPVVVERALAAGYQPVSFLMNEKRFAEWSGRLPEQIPVYLGTDEVLSQITGYQLTRGMLCAMERRVLPSVQSLIKDAKRIAVLEQVMNPTNVGAMIRSAAALGIDAVLLTHGCSDPLYRRAVRVSLGTVFQIPWTIFGENEWPEAGMQILREAGFRTAAMALCPETISIRSEALQMEERLAIILGTEGDGLSSQTIAHCDYTVRIPMFHNVDSLNVAAASAVAFFQLGSHSGKD